MRWRSRPDRSKRCRSFARLLVLVVLIVGGAPAVGAAHPAIPVLCYHGFADGNHPDAGRLTESYERFEAMLRFLAENGFRSVLPDEVRAGRVPERAVILTFDDGVRDQLRAAEMMERYGFRGVFFVIPARLESGDERYMTPEEARRLARAGHRVAPHGYAHRSLPGSGDETAASLVRSRPLLHETVGPEHPIQDFAFPFGHYGDAIVDAMSPGFRFLHTVNPGYWDGVSPLIPRMLLASDVPLEFYQRYLLEAEDYRPVARLIGPDGGTGDRIEFEISGRAPAGDWAMMAISADRSGRLYAIHPLGESARLSGDTLKLDLRRHMERHYPPDRRAISFALVLRAGDRTRYLTPGYLFWIEAGPPCPAPGDSTSCPARAGPGVPALPAAPGPAGRPPWR